MHTLGDFHIYHDHFEQVKIQLNRKPKKLPHLSINSKNIFSYNISDFLLEDYNSYPTLKARMNI